MHSRRSRSRRRAEVGAPLFDVAVRDVWNRGSGRHPAATRFRPQVGPLEERVLLSAAPTFTAVSLSSASAVPGQSVTATATVTSQLLGADVPSDGTVQFTLDGAAIGTPAPVSGGAATVAITAPAAGVHTIGATYSGDGVNFAASQVGAPETIVAGNGSQGYGGDGGPALSGSLNQPFPMAMDSAGDLFIGDGGNYRIREVVKATDTITTVAGNGVQGYTADGAQATLASIGGVTGLAVDAAGDVYFTDQPNNNVIREVVKATGTIVTVAGRTGFEGYDGDGGPATSALLNDPTSLATDAAGDLFFIDAGNNAIREVVQATGDIITVAGNGTRGYSGDGGPATSAELKLSNAPRFEPLTVDGNGNVFFYDSGNARIREVVKATGNIITVAGNGIASQNYVSSGPATSAELGDTASLAVDAAGNIVLASNAELLEVSVATGNISQIALRETDGMVLDAAGNLFVSDYFQGNSLNRIAAITAPAYLAVYGATSASTTTTVTSSLNSSTYGQAVTFTAAVAATPSTLLPTGTVQFLVDSANFGIPQPLSGGTASLNTSTVPAGTHTVSANYINADGHFVNSAGTVASALTVAPATTTTAMRASISSPTYGQGVAFTAYLSSVAPSTAIPTGTVQFQVDGVNLGTPVAVVNGMATSLADSLMSAGNHAITAIYTDPSGNESGNTGTLTGGLTVRPAGLSITPDNQTKVYGAALPVLTVSYSGFVNGDTPASLTTLPTITTTATAASRVLTYSITAAGAVDSNYTINYGPGTLTVTPAPLTIFIDDKTRVYGAVNPTLTITYSGLVNGDTASSLGKPGDIVTTAGQFSHVGTYPITSGGQVSANYIDTYVAGTLTVTPAPLTITADDLTTVYGAPFPVLTASYAGLAAIDTPASLTTQPTLTTTATASSPVGDYPISISGAVDSDYTISYVAGTLAINPAALTITADNQTKVYGAAMPALTASYSGLVNGDTPASLTTLPTLATTGTSSSSVGTYPITISGAVDPNYTIAYVSGTLTVTPVSLTVLTIKADDKTKAYGAPMPVLTASYSGFVNGDTPASLTTQPTLTTTATASSPVGDYPITISGAADPNYTISAVAGTLNIIPVALTITADNQTKAYGAALPVLTASYSGFVNGDTLSSLTTPPTLTTAATSSSHAGSYSITASGAVDPNYTITYVGGTLRVTPVSLTITADNKTKRFGAAVPPLTARYSGFVNGDTPSSLATPPVLSTAATASSPPGNDPIAVSGASDPDYSIHFVAGALTILSPVTGDYNGDGKTDLALFYRAPNSSQGTWFIPGVTPGNGTPFGAARLDVPIEGDFNGDGKADIAVYRPSTGQWLVRGQATVNFGAPNLDIPVPGDYDGVGKSEYAVYRPTTGQWFIAGDSTAVVINVPGYKPKAGDIPAPADYNGDGKIDEAVYRPGTGQWFIEGQPRALQFGGPNEIPVPGDYDGVGHAELALFRPTTDQWFVAGSTAFSGVSFGGPGDVPVPGDYDGIGRTQIAVYRQSTGQWFIAGHATPMKSGGLHFVPAGAPYAYRSISGSLHIKQAAYRKMTCFWLQQNTTDCYKRPIGLPICYKLLLQRRRDQIIEGNRNARQERHVVGTKGPPLVETVGGKAVSSLVSPAFEMGWRQAS